jgi:hypothetical protein
MAMTQEQLDALVARLEDEADRNPGFYRLRLGAFAALAMFTSSAFQRS